MNKKHLPLKLSLSTFAGCCVLLGFAASPQLQRSLGSGEQKAVAETSVEQIAPVPAPVNAPANENYTQARHTPIMRVGEVKNVSDSPVLYGIYYHWTGNSALDVSELYSFNADEVVNFVRECPKVTYMDALTATMHDGKLYCFNNGTINVFDVATGKILEEDIPFKKSDDSTIIPMKDSSTFDVTTGKFYMIYWAGSGINMYKAILSWDPATHEVVEIAALSNTSFPLTMTSSPDGKLYTIMFGAGSSLVEIDKTNGQCKTIIDKLNGCSFNNAGAHAVATVFDHSDGMLYAVGGTDNNGVVIAKIDPKDGKCEIVGKMPNEEHFMALSLAKADDADAPGFASGMEFADGTLTFTAPSKTYSSNKALSGNLTAYVKVRDGQELSQTVTPGQKVSMDLPLPSGQSIIELSMGNAKGKSPFRRLSVVVDDDVPGPVHDLKLKLVGNTNEAQLTWTKPTTAVHGGTYNDEDVRYRITRYPDMVVVSENQKETSFTDRLPDIHYHYYYGVTSMNMDRPGDIAYSNDVLYGSTWQAPYTENFESQSDFDYFTVIDADNDDNKWGWDSSWNTGKAYLSSGHHNDYLVTPKVSMKKDIEYLINFHTFNHLDPETIEILIGTKPEITGNERVIAKVVAESHTDYENTFHVDADGIYYIFFHNTYAASLVQIDRIDFDIYAYFAAPAKVDNLDIKAGEKGVLYNYVKFNAPSKTFDGKTLTGLDRIEIYREGTVEPVKVFDNIKPGQLCEWTDEEVRQGNVTYKIIPYNEVGRGQYIKNTNWVGLDMPSDVTNIKARMNENEKAEVTFDRVGGIGLHGGYVDPDAVTYQLYRYNRNNPLGIWWEPVLEPTKELTITDTDFVMESGRRQQDVNYKLVAVNKAGESEGKGFNIILGKPYKSPYTESFANCETDKGPWCFDGSMFPQPWNVVNGVAMAVKPYDNDKGMMQYKYMNETSIIGKTRSPRINLTTVKEPEFSCMMWHGMEAEPEDLSLIIWANYDDEGWKQIGEVPYNNGMIGWGRYSVALEKGHNDVQFGFGAYAVDASAAIYVDLLKVDNALERDLVVQSISMDANRVEAGDKLNITACVSNYGVKPAENYTVSLRRDNKVVQTVEGKPLMKSNEMIFYPFTFQTSKTDAKETMSFDVVVNLDDDQNEDNNKSAKVSAYIHGTQYPTPLNLTGAKVDNGVNLAWDQPEENSIPVEKLESFEDYEPFIIDEIGDWLTYDGDGEITMYLSTARVPNAFEPQAWMVWAPEPAGLPVNQYPMVAPHSGDKVLVSWGSSDGSINALPNDDWLISPEVKGGTDISFYYRQPLENYAPAKFEVLFSTTDQDPIEFEVLGSGSAEDNSGYFFFEFTLPEDAKYFAIRSCSTDDYFAAFLDDITFTPLNGETQQLTFKGYNVYRDGVVIAENVKECKYTDLTAHGVQTYHVSAVWNEGESNPIGGISLDASVSDNIADSSVVVKGMQGAVYVKSAAGTDVNIVTTAGLTVFNSHVDNDAIISLTPGIYMVRAGGKTYKVMVK